MQVVVNTATQKIVGTASDLPVGESAIRNGQFILQIPDGAGVSVDPTSYVTPQDPGSIPGLAAGELLNRYPMYDHVFFNYFIEDVDIEAIDLAGPQPTSGSVSDVPSWDGLYEASSIPRCQVGRGLGSPLGGAPNSVAILPVNDARSAPTFGSLVTTTLDLTPFNSGNPGTDNILLWWEIAEITASDDVVHGYNVTVDTNTPSFRSVQKVAQEPDDLLVYVSVDDGVSWVQANRLEPVYTGTAGASLRVAFLNVGTRKIYLLGYAGLIQDLP